MYDAKVTKKACISDKPKDSLKKGIRVPFAQVTNPKIKNKAQMITSGFGPLTWSGVIVFGIFLKCIFFNLIIRLVILNF